MRPAPKTIDGSDPARAGLTALNESVVAQTRFSPAEDMSVFVPNPINAQTTIRFIPARPGRLQPVFMILMTVIGTPCRALCRLEKTEWFGP